MSNTLKLYISTSVIVVVFLAIQLLFLYNANENRKAYYECLAVSERVSKEHKENKFVSLPTCRL